MRDRTTLQSVPPTETIAAPLQCDGEPLSASGRMSGGEHGGGGRFLAAVLAFILALPALATADGEKTFNIQRQVLSVALHEFARQSDRQILFSTDVVESKHTAGVQGDLQPEAALTVLLKGTGLTFRITADNTILVEQTKSGETTDTSKSLGKGGSDNSFRLAQTTQGLAQSTDSLTPSSSRNRSGAEQASQQTAVQLEEIIVTAQKREERLQEVPVPVTAINAAELVQNNQLRLQDYYQSVPGLSVTPGVQSTQTIAIRGITTGGGTNPTVGVTVDDVPFGSSTNLGGGLVVPDFDPGDLARVEVLRGPQGSLYGASSMGGLLKFVTVDPSTAGFSGRMQAGAVGVFHGNGLGYNVRGSLNAPVTDTLAVRASAFTRVDPGYIDNPFLNVEGVNEARTSGGRLAALWKPLEDFSLKLAALYQTTRGNGSNDVDQLPGLGDLQQGYIPNVGGYNRTLQSYIATANGKIGTADITSITGYNINSYSDSSDYTYAVGPLTNLLFGVNNSPLYDDNKTKKFNEEVRLAMPIVRWMDWRIGGFFTHESSSYAENVVAQDPATLTNVGEVLGISFPTRYTEYAGFTDLTIHATENFDVELGGRESHIQQVFNQTEIGGAVGGATLITPEERSDANAFTYLVTPRLKLSADLMIYARLASGYRAGGTNATIPGAPSQYNPDKTQNYDLGFKGEFLDHTLSVDASLYYIDWKDIQLQLRSNGLGFNANGGKAKSEGVELSTQVRPITGFELPPAVLMYA